jgi:hypothetical protein
MGNSDQPLDQVQNVSWRYRLNLVLFVSVAILVTLWFYKHVHLYVTESMLIGGTLTLWGVWKIVQTWVKWGLASAGVPPAQKLLGRAGATEYLVLGLVILGVLYLTTSSVYLVYEGATKGEAEFTVEVTSAGNPYLKPVTVTSYQRLAGRPFFLRLSGQDLRFNITSAHGYEPVVRPFRPWTNIYLRVPADFKRKEFHLVRLIPGLQLLNVLPKLSDQPQARYTMRIKCNGKTYPVADLRSQTIYAGADVRDIRALIDKQDLERLRAPLRRYLNERNVPQAAWSRLVDGWESQPRLVSTAEFRAGDQVALRIDLEGAEQPVLAKTFTISKDEMSQTIILEAIYEPH